MLLYIYIESMITGEHDQNNQAFNSSCLNTIDCFIRVSDC